MAGFEHLQGSEDVRSALEELIDALRRTVAAYTLLERRVSDHRIQAAVAQLRQDHERHARELEAVLSEVGGEVVAWDGAEPTAPVLAVVEGERESPRRIVGALLTAEGELRGRYDHHERAGYPEPLHAALKRHLREEVAHIEWLSESHWWWIPAAS